MQTRRVSLGTLLSLLLAAPLSLYADEVPVVPPSSNQAPLLPAAPTDAVPEPCIAYRASTGNFGPHGLNSDAPWMAKCEPGTAFMAVTPRSRLEDTPALASLSGWCCPVPHDALTDVVTAEPEACPPDAIATGIESDLKLGASWDDTIRAPKRIQCTKINTARYRLSPPFGPTVIDNYVNWVIPDLERATLGRFEQLPFRKASQIPLGLRFGFGRAGVWEWEHRFAVGDGEWGSVIIAKNGEGLFPYRFVSLQYVGQPGDPPAGTPVRMYPDCWYIDQILSPVARCVKDIPMVGTGGFAQGGYAPAEQGGAR